MKKLTYIASALLIAMLIAPYAATGKGGGGGGGGHGGGGHSSGGHASSSGGHATGAHASEGGGGGHSSPPAGHATGGAGEGSGSTGKSNTASSMGSSFSMSSWWATRPRWLGGGSTITSKKCDQKADKDCT